jgi:hypothetical protein
MKISWEALRFCWLRNGVMNLDMRQVTAAAVKLSVGVWLVGWSPISKSLVLQGFINQKSRSVTAFRYTEVVHHAGHSI